MIKFKNASFLYKNGQRDAGMRDVSLNIPEGQVVVLCGESGCGKTTLTRMINVQGGILWRTKILALLLDCWKMQKRI